MIKLTKENILRYANRFYNSDSKLTKKDFIEEIKSPKLFRNEIEPIGESLVEFSSIMDKLNPGFMKKNLGAFYTPELYAAKAHKLVFDAIRKHQNSGNKDYVIIDTCSGTGNLIKDLNNNIPSDINDKDILSHVIVNTFEEFEYLVLKERLNNKVRHIFNKPMDALSEEFSFEISKFIKNDTTIIVLENPPYSETTSVVHQKDGKGKESSSWKKSFIVSEAKKEIKGSSLNDMVNMFIYKAIKYYVIKPEDSLIVFSPIKYWKHTDWFKNEFNKGFIFNRRHFHTQSDAAVLCAMWNGNKKVIDNIKCEAFDIKENKLVSLDFYNVKKVKTTYSKKYYDKRIFKNDIIEIPFNGKTPTNAKSLWSSKNGDEYKGSSIRVKSIYNNNIIGYLTAQSNTFELPMLMTQLSRLPAYNGNGFYLRKDNFIEKLPMFAAGMYCPDNWPLNGTVYRSGDGSVNYFNSLKDEKVQEWLNKVAFFVGLHRWNKSKSFVGSNGKIYKNELCLDNDSFLQKYLFSRGFFDKCKMSEREINLLSLHDELLKLLKDKTTYNENFTYGICQIFDEFSNDNDILELLKEIQNELRKYYKEEIEFNLFRFEFLK